MLKKRAWPRHSQRLGVSLSGDINWGFGSVVRWLVGGMSDVSNGTTGIHRRRFDTRRATGTGTETDGRGSSLTWAVGWSQGICFLPKVVDWSIAQGHKRHTPMLEKDVMVLGKNTRGGLRCQGEGRARVCSRVAAESGQTAGDDERAELQHLDSSERKLPVAAAGFSRVPVHAPLIIWAGFSRVQGSRWVLNLLLSHPLRLHHQSPQCFNFFFSKKGLPLLALVCFGVQIPPRYLIMGRAARRLDPRENRGLRPGTDKAPQTCFPLFFS